MADGWPDGGPENTLPPLCILRLWRQKAVICCDHVFRRIARILHQGATARVHFFSKKKFTFFSHRPQNMSSAAAHRTLLVERTVL